jgi:hypothetical protein
MGIGIFARWRGMTSAQADAQIAGFSIKAGNVGYLREAYHGEPYATRLLVLEAFEADGQGAAIPAARSGRAPPRDLGGCREARAHHLRHDGCRGDCGGAVKLPRVH